MQEMPAPLPKKEELDDREKILKSLEKFGLHESLHEEVVQRLILLEQESRFNEDSRKIERGVEHVFDFLESRYAERYPQLVFTQAHKIEGRIAAILHDIGKTGPAEAGAEESKTIVIIFAQEEIKDPGMSLGEVIAENFSLEDGDIMAIHLKSCGIDLQTTMRQFWDMHAQWTHDILEKFPAGLNNHTRIIAGSHHFNKGINPYKLSESEIPLQSEAIGLMEEYIDYIDEIEGRILMAVDQYEAKIRRGSSSHKQAIDWVRDNIKKSKNFKNDEIVALICDAIDELGGEGKIFL